MPLEDFDDNTKLDLNMQPQSEVVLVPEETTSPSKSSSLFNKIANWDIFNKQKKTQSEPAAAYSQT